MNEEGQQFTKRGSDCMYKIDKPGVAGKYLSGHAGELETDNQAIGRNLQRSTWPPDCEHQDLQETTRAA
jgi:hypothetical protein